MKQIVFVSGKGGTGKSTLVSSLSMIIGDKMLADCDVDAPNLHIILKYNNISHNEFWGGKEAYIDPSLCSRCGVCINTCRFDAINSKLKIEPIKCEGCGACVLVCPEKAIILKVVKTGDTYVSETKQGTFSHALLDIGAEGSGKLVTKVRRNAENIKKNEKFLLIDGSPGIGCVVIASITGADAVVAVAEPTKSGQKDLERVLGVARHFSIPSFVCINKYDLNLMITKKIEKYCLLNGVSVIGEIPFDQNIVNCLQELRTPVEAGNKKITDVISSLWDKLMENLNYMEVQ